MKTLVNWLITAVNRKLRKWVEERVNKGKPTPPMPIKEISRFLDGLSELPMTYDQGALLIDYIGKKIGARIYMRPNDEYLLVKMASPSHCNH